jgi:hypothetical protein
MKVVVVVETEERESIPASFDTWEQATRWVAEYTVAYLGEHEQALGSIKNITLKEEQ